MARKRWLWAVGICLGVAVLGGGGMFAIREDLAYARIATGFAAKQTCSCLHVSGRPLESCLGDFPEDARQQLSISDDANVTRASVLFGAISAEARYDGAYGCVIQN